MMKSMKNDPCNAYLLRYFNVSFIYALKVLLKSGHQRNESFSTFKLPAALFALKIDTEFYVWGSCQVHFYVLAD